MKKFMTPILAIMLSVGLVACTPRDGISPSLPKTDAKADEVFVEANTPEERALRLCFSASVVSEIWVYRMTEEATTRLDRERARTALIVMKDAVADLKNNIDTMWFETEMIYGVKSLVDTAETGVRQRLLDRLTSFASGSYSPLDFFRGVRTTLGQTAIANAMVQDIRRLYDEAGFLFPEKQEEAWAHCADRIEKNINKLSF